MGFLKQHKFIIFTMLLSILVSACGGGIDRPFSLSKEDPEIPIFDPDADNPDAENSGGEEPSGCEVKMTDLTLDLKVSANQNGTPIEVLDAAPVAMGDLTFVISGNNIRLLGAKFPAVRLTELAEDNDVIVRGNAPGNVGVGTIDADGNIEIEGFRFIVDITSGKESNASILGSIESLPKVQIITGTVTATGNHNDISVEGSPLNPETKELTLVAKLTIPTGTLLDGGGIGGGALTAAFKGKFDKLPNDPSCSGGSLELGPAKIQVQRLTYTVDQEEILEDLAANTFDFGEKFAGSTEEKSLFLRIKSLGEQALVINKIQTTLDGPFIVLDIDGNNLNSISISPGEYKDIQIQFNPKQQHITQDQTPFNIPLQIKNNDPDKSDLSLMLKALGLAPAPRLSLRVLKKSESSNEYSFMEAGHDEFMGTVTYANTAGVPKKLYRLFRVYNTGVLSLPLNEISPLIGEFNLGVLRYGVNTFRECETGEDPNEVSDDCSVSLNPNLFNAENNPNAFHNIEAADLNDLAKSPHLDILVTYQPIDFSLQDSKILKIASKDGQKKEVILNAEVDDNSRAKLVLWVDESPENTENFDQDLIIPNHTRYNFKRVLDPETDEVTVDVYAQNSGVVGGEKLKLDPEQIVLDGGDLELSFLTDQADSKLNSGLEASANPAEGDGKVLLGKLKITLPENRTEIKKIVLRIPAFSVKENGQASQLEDDYEIKLYYGLPEGEMSFKLTKGFSAIQNSLVKDPTETDDSLQPGSIPMHVQFSGQAGVVIHYLSSTQPNFVTFPDEGSKAPACSGTAEEQKQCAEQLAPVRLDTTTLGTSNGPCHEGDYDGKHEAGECSYFVVSFAGKAGSNFRTGVLNDTDMSLSNMDLNEDTLKVRMNIHDVLVRLINSEHNKMNSTSGYFDQVFNISFSTGIIDSDFAGFGANSYPPLEDSLPDRSINKGKFAPYICDGEEDGDANFADCDLPADLPADHGLLIGRDWDLTDNSMTIVGATRWDNSTALHFPNDDFFSLLGPSNFYVVLRGVMCGDSIGVSCD